MNNKTVVVTSIYIVNNKSTAVLHKLVFNNIGQELIQLWITFSQVPQTNFLLICFTS